MQIIKKVILVLLMSGVIITSFIAHRFYLYTPSDNKYPLRGVDVSHHQGKIDWEALSKDNIQFAYIKATEGSG